MYRMSVCNVMYVMYTILLIKLTKLKGSKIFIFGPFFFFFFFSSPKKQIELLISLGKTCFFKYVRTRKKKKKPDKEIRNEIWGVGFFKSSWIK